MWRVWSEEAGGTVTFTITLSQAVNAGNSVSIDITDVAGAGETSNDTTLALQAAIDAALPAGVTRVGRHADLRRHLRRHHLRLRPDGVG